jgi:hypothetical protein
VSEQVEVSNVGARTPHNEGLYDAGRALLVESVAVGREFCKSMITVSSSAIPIYVGLVGLTVGDNFHPTVGQGLVLLLGPVVLLGAATVFALGYFPKQVAFSLDLPGEIEAARLAIVRKRQRLAIIGFVLCVAGVVLSGVGIFYGLSLHGAGRA